jgi:hypothetical protein
MEAIPRIHALIRSQLRLTVAQLLRRDLSADSDLKDGAMPADS